MFLGKNKPSVIVNLTSICPHKCNYCVFKKYLNDKPFNSDYLDRLDNIKDSHIILSGGEPTLLKNDDLDLIVNYIDSSNLITMNTTLFNESWTLKNKKIALNIHLLDLNIDWINYIFNEYPDCMFNYIYINKNQDEELNWTLDNLSEEIKNRFMLKFNSKSKHKKLYSSYFKLVSKHNLFRYNDNEKLNFILANQQKSCSNHIFLC